MMPVFRRVNGDQAGPRAVGVLVPPGRRTLLIVRPRALAWDLVIVHGRRGTGPTTTFRDFSHEEALAASEGLVEALEQWTAGGPGRVRVVPAPEGDGHLVRAEVGIFPLLVCPRDPGKPYQPMVFPETGEAERAAAAIAAALRPDAEAGREIYFNTRQFAR